MRRCLLVWLACGVLCAQVAERANRHYRTAEGRADLARHFASPGREAHEKPRELVKEMGLKPGMTVADVGTGAGFMLPYLSEAVGPSGRVIAEDIFSDFLDQARQRAEAAGLGNVTFVQGSETAPQLPGNSVDVALVLDAYHHFNYPEQMLAGIRAALRKGGKLVIVDYYRRPGALRSGDALEHIRADEPEVIREIEASGFRLLVRQQRDPGRQYLLLFDRAHRAPARAGSQLKSTPATSNEPR